MCSGNSPWRPFPRLGLWKGKISISTAIPIRSSGSPGEPQNFVRNSWTRGHEESSKQAVRNASEIESSLREGRVFARSNQSSGPRAKKDVSRVISQIDFRNFAEAALNEFFCCRLRKHGTADDSRARLCHRLRILRLLNRNTLLQPLPRTNNNLAGFHFARHSHPKT